MKPASAPSRIPATAIQCVPKCLSSQVPPSPPITQAAGRTRAICTIDSAFTRSPKMPPPFFPSSAIVPNLTIQTGLDTNRNRKSAVVLSLYLNVRETRRKSHALPQFESDYEEKLYNDRLASLEKIRAIGQRGGLSA